MGTLGYFPLEWIKRRHNLRGMVETGTADGHGVAVALRAGFDPIHSVEIMANVAQAAQLRFESFKQVQIWGGDSRRCLPMILRDLPPEPCLFWLDAHFPGAHGHGQEYDAEPDAARRLPLHEELLAIRSARPDSRDVILIDDARIYVPGPYQNGDAPPEVIEAVRGVVERGPDALQFVRDIYGETHEFVIDGSHEGYGLVFPKAQLRKAA